MEDCIPSVSYQKLSKTRPLAQHLDLLSLPQGRAKGSSVPSKQNAPYIEYVQLTVRRHRGRCNSLKKQAEG